MKSFLIAATIVLNFYCVAVAGPFTDEMARCIVKETTDSDKTLFIKWIYAAISSHPDVESMANITPKQKEKLNKDAAEMITELLTNRCREQCKQAVKYEGGDSFKASFEVLGQVAMQGLMTHQQVTEYLSSLEKYFDEDKLNKTFKE